MLCQVPNFNCDTECHQDECRYAECHRAECRGTTFLLKFTEEACMGRSYDCLKIKLTVGTKTTKLFTTVNL